MNTVLVSTASPINYPNIGSLYLIDALKQNGIETTHLDSSVEFSELEEKLIKSGSKSLNMSVITSPEIENSVNLARRVKWHHPDVNIIWGGIHPTINAEQCISENYVDTVVTGNAEGILPSIVRDIDNGGEVGGIIKSPPIKSLDSFTPHWDSIPVMSDFLFPETHSVRGDTSGEKNIFYYLDTSRGCPHSCSFCAINTSGKWYAHSLDWFNGQVDLIDRRLKEEGTKMDGIGLWDDMFWANKKRAYDILGTLKDRKLGYLIEARADQLMRNNSELTKKLQDTGCMQVFIGAESGNQDTLDYLNKKTNVSDYYKLMDKAGKNGMSTRFSLIVGFPYETDKSVNQTLDLAKRINDSSYCSVSGPKLYTPYPGTLEFERAVERGFRTPRKTQDWGKIHRHSEGYISKFPWLEENLTKKTLKRVEKEIR